MLLCGKAYSLVIFVWQIFIYLNTCLAAVYTTVSYRISGDKYGKNGAI